jgi:hypothetical protein
MRAFCSSNNDFPRRLVYLGLVSRNPEIKLDSLVTTSGRRTQSERGNLRTPACFSLSQLDSYWRDGDPCCRLRRRTLRLAGGCEGCHLQESGMANRFFCPKQMSRNGWDISGPVARGTDDGCPLPGQDYFLRAWRLVAIQPYGSRLR